MMEMAAKSVVKKQVPFTNHKRPPGKIRSPLTRRAAPRKLPAMKRAAHNRVAEVCDPAGEYHDRSPGPFSRATEAAHHSLVGAHARLEGAHGSSVSAHEPSVPAHRLPVGADGWRVGAHRLPVGTHATPVGAHEPSVGPNGTSVAAHERPGNPHPMSV